MLLMKMNMIAGGLPVENLCVVLLPFKRSRVRYRTAPLQRESLAQGHFSRECVYPQKVMNCGWRTTCCSLYHHVTHISSPLLSSPLPFCQEMRWLTPFQTVLRHKGNCCTHASCGELTGDKVHPLCESVVLQPTHKHTSVHCIHVYWAST